MASGMNDRAGHGGQRPASGALAGQPRPGAGPHLHRRFDESWVEVSSQPSSSSLSSIGDEIVTTGLQVGGHQTRRRRLQPSARSLPQEPTAIYTAATSSQEEYDESDSEEEGPLSSSAENLPLDQAVQDSDAESDDGDNATALGRASDRPIFRPQPNAFSHPPSHLAQRSYSSSSAVPSHPHGGFTRPSFSQRSHTRVHRSGPSFMSPHVREENDAALRASLTTLLSCAAAARGLPKAKEEAEARRVTHTGVGPSNQPMDLRLVPESALDKEPAAPQLGTATTASQKPASSTPSPTRTSTSGARATKRSPSAGRSARAVKKKKTSMAANETLISPTLLTWVVSAGVLVLVSVVGFGAGYVIGREVGRQEGLAASVGGVNETASCGREAIRTSGGSLRRFKWGAVGKSIAA